MKKGKFYVLRWFKGYASKVGLIDNINGQHFGYYREKNENGEVVWTSIHIETGNIIETGKNKNECMLKTARIAWLNLLKTETV